MANIPGAVNDPSRVRGEAIEFKSGSDTIQGYLARPAQPGRNPGIVVIHEAFGLVEHIRDIARRFANIGYNALAPDLYTRAGGPANPDDIATVMPVIAVVSCARIQPLLAAFTPRSRYLKKLRRPSTQSGALALVTATFIPGCELALSLLKVAASIAMEHLLSMKPPPS